MMPGNDPQPTQGSEFSRFAADWWDPDGPMRTLHTINPVRLAYIERRIGLSGKQILDLGCGGGLLAEAMIEHGARVTGADLSGELIETAGRHARQRGLEIEYIQGDAQTVLDARGAGRFDAVTCLEMLEHVDDPGKVVEACAKLVKPGGDIVFSTLNRNLEAWLLAIVGAEYIAGLLPRGTHDYGHFIRPAELAACARTCGLEVLDISGLVYLPGLNKAVLSRRPGVNYLLHARRSNT
jgi:2-polyprenyl-6-hydroxyphenyl methylase / 3-demethylubiquinone-9 3-methyltransferase